jgi:methionine biosynthesis protein MetW
VNPTKSKFEQQLDYHVILDQIEPHASVLDLGCGEGDLLALLVKEKKIRGQGIEIDEQAIFKCVEKGLSVFHGDLDTGLADYQDQSIDYVILNETMQQLKKPDDVITEALRVGKKVIVGFPNFCHLSARCQIFFTGHVPVTPSLPYKWYNTPNLHFLSLHDFENYCHSKTIKIMASTALSKTGVIRFFPNLFAHVGIYVISR